MWENEDRLVPVRGQVMPKMLWLKQGPLSPSRLALAGVRWCS